MKSELIETPEEFEFGNYMLKLSSTNPRCKGELMVMISRFKDKPTVDEIFEKHQQFRNKAATYVSEWKATIPKAKPHWVLNALEG